MKKSCVKCEKLKPLTEFNFKNKAKNKRNGRCKECTRISIRAAYYKNRDYYLKYRTRYNKELIIKKHKFLLGYLLEHPCIDCGITDPRVLQFDHVRGKKVRSISEIAYRAGHSLRTLLEEIQKCEVRCANCHARKTATERGYYSRFLEGKGLTED